MRIKFQQAICMFVDKKVCLQNESVHQFINNNYTVGNNTNFKLLKQKHFWHYKSKNNYCVDYRERLILVYNVLKPLKRNEAT